MHQPVLPIIPSANCTLYADRTSPYEIRTNAPPKTRKRREWEAIELVVTSADQPRASRSTIFSRPVGPFVRSTDDDGCGVVGGDDDAAAAAMSSTAS